MAGRRQAVLSKTHPGWIHGVALSSDGKMMASLGEDGMALWDLQTGAREPVFRSDAAKGMGGVVFSPNGKLLATAGQGIVSIWDVADRRLVFSSPKPTPDQALIEANSVTALAFSSDSQTLATGKEEVLLLAAATGREIKRLPAAKSRGRTERLAFSGDGKHLLICQIGLDDELATVLDWNLNDGIVDLKKTPNQTEGDIKAMDGIHAGKVIPMLDVIGRLFLWDLATGDVSDLSEVGPHSFEQLNMALSADGSLVALADKQGSVSLWDTSARRPIGPDRPHPNHAYATAIAFSADQSTLAVGDADGTIVLWHGPKKWEADAAIIANRNLSIEEWKEFMGVGIPYRRTFIDFPPN
jgi:WD40 repeat protein